MSIPALALRLATVFALRDQTWAGTSVLDQPINPIEGLSKATKPVIAVYTGDDVVKADARDWMAGDRTSNLVIQIYLPADLTVPNGPRIDALRDGGEFALGIIWRQIESVLLKDTSPWASLWRSLIFSVHDVSSRPYLIEIETGPRLVARETIFAVDTVASPDFAPPSGLWADLVALMTSTPELQPLATLVDAAIRGGSDLPDWAIAAAQMGMRDGVIRSVGLAPADATEVGEAAPLSSVEVDGLMPAPVVIDEP